MGYQQLKQIADENRKEAEAEANKPITECPECLWPSLDKNNKGQFSCPICKWKS